MRRRAILFSTLAFTVMVAGPAEPAAAADPQRGVAVAPAAPGSVPISGDYWALIIGIDKYQHAPKLESAVKDAKGVRDVLVERYGFKRDHVVELLDERATGSAIQNALYKLGRQAGKDDSVLIYYAGHGQYDEDGRLGWWVPVEGEPREPGTFITNSSIRDYISGMKARHVYLVADSCFSGTLFGTRALPPINDQWYARLYQKSSRWGLTSGGKEPVADRGKDGHSVFAYHFITLLKENSDPYLVPSQIHTKLAPLVANNAEQTPQSEPLKGAGDEGGQFVFRLASASSGPLPPPVAGGASSDEVARMRAELDALKAQINKPAEPPKPIEEARARPYDAPQQMGKEITGQDGAPMVLVPEGEFLYGDNNQKMSLAAFYMDKYEVTTKRYAAFMQATGRVAPERWSEAVGQVGDTNTPRGGVSGGLAGAMTGALSQSGARPQSNQINNDGRPVDWNDAGAYCRQYGKRLPTEQEWEKSARGTDGRKYPWGNEEPTSRHANFDPSGKYERKWQGYATLSAAGDHEAGQSPYGIYDMAGNVWEWTSSDFDNSGKFKVFRGGSWSSGAHDLRSAIRANYIPPLSYRNLNIGFRCAMDAPK